MYLYVMYFLEDVFVLSYQSLLVLVGVLFFEYVIMLGVVFRVFYEDILDIKVLDQFFVIINFEILWKWCGKIVSLEMVDVLVSVFCEVKQKRLIDVIMLVSFEKCYFKYSDFLYCYNCVQFVVVLL